MDFQPSVLYDVIDNNLCLDNVLTISLCEITMFCTGQENVWLKTWSRHSPVCSRYDETNLTAVEGAKLMFVGNRKGMRVTTVSECGTQT